MHIACAARYFSRGGGECIANFFSFFTDDESDIPKRRNSQTYLVDYLKEKPEMEMATKRTELELRKEELRLQKAQFDLDREERLQRMEIEKQEKIAFMDLLKKLTNNK